MVENFFYIEGVEKEEIIRKKLEEKDTIERGFVESDEKMSLPIKRRIAIKQRNFNRKVLVLEEMEIPKEIKDKRSVKDASNYSWIKNELRFGYYIIDRVGNWAWGQFAPFIPKEDFKDLMEKAKELGFI